MSYFSQREVSPTPNADDTPYWEHIRQHRLTFQRCKACARVTHPPIGVCPACQSLEREWIEAPAEARVFSLTWCHTAAHDSVASRLPYNVVVVEFPALPEVRLVSNVIDVAPGELAIGDGLALVWDEAGEAGPLPRFRRR